MRKIFLLIVLVLFNPYKETAYAQNILDELDPRNPNIEEMLKFYDEQYFEIMGKSAIIEDGQNLKGSCRQAKCPVWVVVNKNEQIMSLYLAGSLHYTWKVSTGMKGYVTPKFDRNPNGRVYDRYSSRIYPGGDYNGLGNMPYAVFIQGGYAIHGTIEDNWPDLGTAVSKGCIRLHPDDAYVLNKIVRENGVGSVWITVQ